MSGRHQGIALAFALLAGLLAGLTPPRAVLADSHTVGFDDLGEGTLVGVQYAAQGLTFETSTPAGGSPTLPIVVTHGSAPSQPRAAGIRVQGCGGEFCQNFAMAHFRDAQAHVRVFAGVTSGITSNVRVQGYNEVGTPVADPAGFASATTGGPGAAYVQLDITSSVGDILYASFQGSNSSNTAIDDLTYDVPAAPPPPPPTPAPGTTPPPPGTPTGPGVSPGPGAPPRTAGPKPGAPPVCAFTRKDNAVVGLAQDGTVDVPLVARRSSTWTGALTFSTTGLPSGLVGVFDPPSVSGPGETAVTLHLTATAAPGGDVVAKVVATPAVPGVAPCSADLAFAIRASFSVAVKGFEVTQAIQSNALPQRSEAEASVPYRGVLLAASKKTVVRVFAGARYGPAAGIPNVAATLTGFAAGSSTPLPGSPISPVWGTRTLPVGPSGITDYERRDPNGGFAFELPPAWTTGSIDLEASLTAPTGFFAGVEACNSDACTALLRLRLTGVAFTPTQSVTVLPVAMPVKGYSLAAPSYDCYRTTVHEGIALVGKDPFRCPNNGVFATPRVVAPLGDENLVVAGYQGVVDISDIASSSADKDLQGILATFRLWKYANAHDERFFNDEEFDPKTSNLIIGVLPAESNIRTRAKGADCRDNHDFLECDQWRVATVLDSGRLLTGVSHELFHLFGRYHASGCSVGGADVGNFDDWPPDQKGLLGGYGLDTRNILGASGPFRVLGVDAGPNQGPGRIPIANPWYDFMGYCANPDESDSWVSPRNWNVTLQEYASGGPTSPTGAAPFSPHLAAATSPVLAVDAVSDATGKVYFGTVTPSHRFKQRSVPASAFHLIARDSSGSQVADVGMAVSKMHSEQGPASFDLMGGVPIAGVATLEITHDGKVVARRSRAARAPTVRFISPGAGDRLGSDMATIRWQSDGADVVDTNSVPGVANHLAELDYSADGGRNWKAVYAGADRGMAILPTSLLAGSETARLRVTVNDGFSDGVATSRVFASPGSVPQVHILDPAPDAGLTGSAAIYLSGQALDDRGRQLKDADLSWYVNDRRVAGGRRASVTSLPAGSVVLKLIGRDRNGRIGGAQMCLRVSAAKTITTGESTTACEFKPLRDPGTGTAIPAAGVVPGAASGRPWTVVVVAGGLALLLLAAVALAWRLRGRRATA